MNALLIGYGKMGKLIDALAQDFGISISTIIDPHEKSSERVFPSLLVEHLKNVDVAIDFSTPHHLCERVELLLENHIPLVIGTTGWQKDAKRLQELNQKKGGKIIASANFSIGVFLFLEAAKRILPLFENCSDYDAAISEIHHRQKKDHPSGTALMLADIVLKSLSRKTAINSTLPDDALDQNLLQIDSLRVGSNPGEHEVVLDSLDDTITLRHSARSRQGFARGALQAALFIKKSAPGWYGLEDLLLR